MKTHTVEDVDGNKIQVQEFNDDLTVEDVAKTTVKLRDAINEIKDSTVVSQKEGEERMAELVKTELETQFAKASQRRVIGLSNDYSMTGQDLFLRSMEDTGPHAREMRGEPLNTADSLICRFQAVCDLISAGSMQMGIGKSEYTEEVVGRSMTKGDKSCAKSRALWNEFLALRKEIISTRTNTTIDTTEMTNWMPTLFTPQVQNRYTLALKVVALFRTAQMTRSPMQMPVMWSRKSLANSMHNPELTAAPNSASMHTPAEDVTPSVMTLTAKTSKHFTPISWEVDWDSIIALTPLLLTDHGDFHAWAQENAVVNGDTTSPHQDTNVTGGSNSVDFRAAYKGLRKLAIAGSCQTNVNTNPYQTVTLRGIRENMKKYGVSPAETKQFHGPISYIKLLSNQDVKTVDVLGPKATVPTGTLAIFDGHPIVVSEAMQENLDTDGCVDSGGVSDNHAYMFVNTLGFLVGQRMPIQTIYSEDALILYGGKCILSLARNAFAPLWTPSTTVPTVWYGYNADN